ncbi:hypothetical protein [Motilibacter peucedani]|uniref:hypothetical protein n=1 Tax=Motilibacter peucedani TaxID=598650 RepID=UPI000EAD5511|nr:hypothetical protein [Motilibacter peucedani]
MPGDPVEILRAARQFAAVADEVERQAAELRALAQAPGATSEAVDALRDAAGAVAVRLGRVPSRYRVAAGALTEWAGELESAQELADRALLRAQAAAADVSPDGPTELARDELRRAQHLLAEAVDSRDRAERRARDALERARHSDHLDDGRFAGVHAALHEALHEAWSGITGTGHWFADLHHLAALCSWVSTVTGVLSLVFCLVPGLNGALAAASLLTGCVGLLADAELARRGQGSLATVGADALGIALGRVGGKGLLGAVSGLRSETARVSAAAAESATRTAAAPRVAAATRTLRRPGAGALSRARAQLVLDDVEGAVAAARSSAAGASLAGDLPRITRGDLRLMVVAGGDLAAARAAKLAQAAAAAHPADLGVARAAADAGVLVRRIGVARGLASAYDLWGKVPVAVGAAVGAVTPRHHEGRARRSRGRAAVAW